MLLKIYIRTDLLIYNNSFAVCIGVYLHDDNDEHGGDAPDHGIQYIHGRMLILITPFIFIYLFIHCLEWKWMIKELMSYVNCLRFTCCREFLF